MRNAIKSTTIADRVLLALLVISSLTGMFYSRDALSKGEDVLVEINGKLTYTLPLSQDREITVNASHGQATIEIKDGRVKMKQAECGNHICMKQGWIKSGSIVCLPNGIVITIGNGRKKDLDAVTG